MEEIHRRTLEGVGQYRFHRAFDGTRGFAGVRSQQRVPDDRVRESHHLGRDIQRLAIRNIRFPPR